MSNVRIACVSDMHGHLPDPAGIDCDFAIVAGDICPDGPWTRQLAFLNGPFREWCQKWPWVFWIAGNHDLILRDSPELVRIPYKSSYLIDSVKYPAYPMRCLSNLYHRDPKFAHLGIAGSPWTLSYGYGWAFMGDESLIASKLERLIFPGCILVTHGPPYGIGDRVERDEEHAGSKTLAQAISSAKPRLVVCGHIHEGWGIHDLDGVPIVNASICDESRYPTRKPIVVDVNF